MSALLTHIPGALMLKRLTLFAVVLLAPSFALAEEEVSPPPPPSGATATKLFEPKFGVVFNLQNIFQNPGLLSGFRGGVGVQFALSTPLALRLGVSLSHTSDPAVVTETVTTINDMTTTTRTMNRPSPTSTFGLTVGGDLLAKITEGALAPYVGGGLWVNLDSEATKLTDDVTVTDQVTAIDNSTLGFGLGARGVLGVGWRVHPHFYIFAEYALNLTVVDHSSTTMSQQVTTTGNPPVSARSSRASTRVFDFSTALSQGAALGLVAFF